METHNVPQQIQYKDEFLWGMTVRQVALIGLFGIPAYAVFKAPLPFVLRIFLALPFVSAGLMLAFYQHRGKFLEVWLINWLAYKASPHYYRPLRHGPSPSLSSLLRRLMCKPGEEASPISSQVPIKGIRSGMIHTDFGYVMVLKCGALNYHLMSEDAKLKAWSSYHSFLNVLSLGFPIQFHAQVRRQTVDDILSHFDEVIEAQPTAGRVRLAETLRDFVVETVSSRSVVSRNFYIAIPYNPNFTCELGNSSVFRGLFSRASMRSEDVSFEIASKQLATRRDQVIAQMKKLGIEAAQLDNHGLFELIYNGFNPSVARGGMVKHDLTGMFDMLGEESMVEFLSPSYLRVGPDFADVAGVHVRTILALDFPGSVYNGWLQPLMDLDVDMDVSIHISPLDSNGVIKLLQKNLSRMLSTRRYRAHKGKMEDFHVEAKTEDGAYLLNRLIRNETKMFNMGLYVTVRSLDAGELDERTNSVLATCESMQIVPAVAKYQMSRAIASNLPIAQDRLCVYRNFESDGIADGMPLTSADLSSQGHICYGLNADNSTLVFYDCFASRNSSQVVLGSSGSGKSWFSKASTLSYLLHGTYASGKREPVSIVIIDPEREYEAICEAVGGQYVTISRNPSQHINPFDPYVDNVEGMRGVDWQVGDAEVLIKLMAPDLEVGKAQLEELLYTMFREKDAPQICDLHRIAGEAGFSSLAEALYPWNEGSYRNIFSQPTDVDLNSDYIVFDISEMDDEMRPVAMQVILSWLWRNIFANPKPRLIYVDEAWCLLKSAGDWFAAAYKRARKHWAGFSINDHEVETLLNSDVMKTILTNSATKLLFTQEPSAVPALTRAFDLTEMEQQAILTGSPGEALFYAENSHVRLKVITPPEWDSFLSTSPSVIYARRAANA
jgi:hypothetical protein